MVNILNVFLFKIIGHRLLVTILCVSADCQEQFTDINQKMPAFVLQKECGARTDCCLLLHHIIWLSTSLCPNILKQLPVYLKRKTLDMTLSCILFILFLSSRAQIVIHVRKYLITLQASP